MSHQPLPTREQLSNQYGFDVPDAFVTLVQLAYCHETDPKSRPRPASGSDDPRFYYEEVCSLILEPECRYQQTPPELFPIGHMGVDGVHYGYVIHAPELPRSEYPLGELCPMDSGGVFLLGTDTRNAIENLLSAYQLQSEKPEDPIETDALDRKVEEICRALQISPHPTKAHWRYGPDENGLPIVPDIPPGWRYLPTSDGIGVLAKREHFADYNPTLLEENRASSEFIDRGQEVLAAGFPATALALFREGYWNQWVYTRLVHPLAEGMCKCYRLLGRPQLADVLEKNLADHKL